MAKHMTRQKHRWLCLIKENNIVCDVRTGPSGNAHGAPYGTRGRPVRADLGLRRRRAGCRHDPREASRC